ncbi:DUF4097 family beta strand repeat-containing protein [Brachybacterium sp. YJGR34]|uniref:DUF4097 family beta strand repeat-containing protein n=1 Tax=Brachybacterium sp. YJGR34 TaxID=2059911 RepID=UPI000E0CA603|nr:DUF4097 family beta strand repeat-containing protein [Brachybacterium sp. YJGR34]
MSTTYPSPTPDLAAQVPSGPYREPARRLSPDPRKDGPWRVVVIVIAALVIGTMVLGAVAASTVRWLDHRSFEEVAATTELGLPASLTLTSGAANVRVLESADAEQVTVALVEEGATAVPETGTEVRARVTQQGRASDPVLDVRQPRHYTSFPGQLSARDLLILVPSGHELALDLTTEVGDIRAEGTFTSLDIGTDVGSVRLTPVSAPEGLTVRSDVGQIEVEVEDPAPGRIEVTGAVGDVDLLLPADAGGEVLAASDLGEVSVSAPGTGRWEVEATAELGDLRVDPSLTTAEGSPIGTLTATSEVGNVVVSR